AILWQASDGLPVDNPFSPAPATFIWLGHGAPCPYTAVPRPGSPPEHERARESVPLRLDEILPRQATRTDRRALIACDSIDYRLF
ncbi:hypothetical protein, partial [Roseiflexus sp.]|uniref:hypothetical protein n=1 Tax=Roseiflexus sp. TaxID=2562120 RepID=UPI00398B973B